MKTSAQNKEDLVLIQYFKGKHGGVFVDVGAHDGIQFSNTHSLEVDYGWSGICIEPHPDSFKKLVKNRPNSKCFEVAIVNSEDKVVQLAVPNGVPVLGSVKPSREGIGQILGIQSGQVNYKMHNVFAKPLEFIYQGELYDYDLLSVDTEWTELDVLKSASLHMYTPEVIVVEANDRFFANEIVEYLIDFGYELCGFVGGINYFFVDLSEPGRVKKMQEAIAYVASGRCPNV